MSSVFCEAGSLSDYEFIHREPLPGDPRTIRGDYQISQFLKEPPNASPWTYRSSTIDLNSEGNPIWLTRSSLNQQAPIPYHCRGPQLLTQATDAFEPIAVCRTGTSSSVNSDDSHYSTPKTLKLVKTWDNNRSCVSDESELETDSDGDEDAFESLNTAIISVLGPDRAMGLIPHLYQLPAHLRAFVFGFATHNCGEDDTPTLGYQSDAGPSMHNPTQGLDGRGTSKRKRRSAADDASPPGAAQERKTRAKQRKKVEKLAYACPFNIFDRKKYCVRNEIGGTGSHYSACMGPGFSEPRRLIDHFESAHRTPQCERCWKIFDNSDLLSYHTNEEEPRCENRKNLLVREKEMITETEWKKIQTALSQPRLRKGKDSPRKTGRDQWFEVWDILFPKSTYPNVPRPSYPYYVNPEGPHNPPPKYPEVERMIELWKVLWNKKVEDAKASDPEVEYHPSREDIENMIREAATITSQSAASHLPAPIGTESLAHGPIPPIHGPSPPIYGPSGNYSQPGYHHTTPSFDGDTPLHGINPSALHNLDTLSPDPYDTGYYLSEPNANDLNPSLIFDFNNLENVAAFGRLVQNMPKTG